MSQGVRRDVGGLLLGPVRAESAAEADEYLGSSESLGDKGS